MSKRPILDKKVARMRRALRKGRLPAFFDLVDWLKDRGYAQTTGQALKLIRSERVKAESHVLGLRTAILPDTRGRLVEQVVVYTRIPAEMRDSVVVEPA